MGRASGEQIESTVPSAREQRCRCAVCGRSRPESETASIRGHVGGDYRRPSRRGWRRVCRDCVQERVDYVRGAQAKRLNVPLNEHRFRWQEATELFEIDVSDLQLDRCRYDS